MKWRRLEMLKNDNLYDEMRQMRDQLLTRIEMLEDDVERLSKENMDAMKELYILERAIDERIDILSQDLTQLNISYEGQEGSKTDYQESKETS